MLEEEQQGVSESDGARKALQSPATNSATATDRKTRVGSALVVAFTVVSGGEIAVIKLARGQVGTQDRKVRKGAQGTGDLARQTIVRQQQLGYERHRECAVARDSK